MGWDGIYVDAVDSVKCSFDVREITSFDFKCKKSLAKPATRPHCRWKTGGQEKNREAYKARSASEDN
jgi:hypothetical protein